VHLPPVINNKAFAYPFASIVLAFHTHQIDSLIDYNDSRRLRVTQQKQATKENTERNFAADIYPQRRAYTTAHHGRLSVITV
jgi:hypothetical protein